METPKAVRERMPVKHDETGGERGSDAVRKPPAAPAEDDPSPLGDTEQQSDADA
jgi:hypothetical protein